MERKIILKKDLLDTFKAISLDARQTVMVHCSLHLVNVRIECSGKYNTVEGRAIMKNGVCVWKSYKTLFMDGEDFDQIGQVFEVGCPIAKTALGNRTVTFMHQRKLVDFAVRWIEENRK